MKIDPDKLKACFMNSEVSLMDLAQAAGYASERRITQLFAGKSVNINLRIGEALAKKLKCKTGDIT
jgi:DNA-binding Xre family transcriptional regulator